MNWCSFFFLLAINCGWFPASRRTQLCSLSPSLYPSFSKPGMMGWILMWHLSDIVFYCFLPLRIHVIRLSHLDNLGWSLYIRVFNYNHIWRNPSNRSDVIRTWTSLGALLFCQTQFIYVPKLAVVVSEWFQFISEFCLLFFLFNWILWYFHSILYIWYKNIYIHSTFLKKK